MFSRRIIAVLMLTALTTAAFAGTGQRTRNAQGYLGIVPGDLNQHEIAKLHVHGVEVLQVDHDGPAAKAGLRVHDIITELGGKAVDGADHLRQMLQSTAPGRVISVVIFRDGHQQTLTAKLADKVEVEKQAWEQHMTVPEPSESEYPGLSTFLSISPASMPPVPDTEARPEAGVRTTVLSASYSGAVLESLSPQLADYFGAQGGSPLLVRNVEPGSPAATAGMRAGDVVVRIGINLLATPSDWTRAMLANRGKSISIGVMRDKREETLTLTPDARHRSSLEPAAPRLLLPPATVLMVPPLPVVDLIVVRPLPVFRSL
jgi:S1-C subfamily serine protease